MVDIPNQNNFQDIQNFKIDIDQIYSDFIQEIDANRSNINISNPSNQAILQNFKENSIIELSKKLKIENDPQESRSHTFFRLIGFPVVSKDNVIYNGGFDIIRDASRTITTAIKINIANNIDSKFRDLSTKREAYVTNFAQIFSLNKSINAATLALSSGVKIRKFVVPFDKDSDAFDFDVKNQSYTVDFHNLVGKTDTSLLTYTDANGNLPDAKVFGLRSHIIKPFFVDPRIDLTVNPNSRLVAIPFVTNKTDTLVGENTFVKRPLLEKVIRDRFVVSDQISTTGTNDQSVIDYIKSVPNIQDENLIKQVTSGDVYKLADQTQFIKFLNIIRAMMIELVNAQVAINIVQSRYYWLPIPSTSGPEGGSSVRGVIISKDLPTNLITPQDQSIINATIKVIMNKIDVQVADASGTPDVGGFAFDSLKSTFNSDTSGSLGDLSEQNLQTLTGQRSHDMTLANNALRTVEIIMGEFSGLGLCDIIAIMGALYIMPKENLLGFLDDDALVRMNNSLNLSESKPGIVPAMNSLASTVKDFYNLMDKIYQDLAQRNGLS